MKISEVINKLAELKEKEGDLPVFISTILENTQDLNLDFSKLVDEHFWDLV